MSRISDQLANEMNDSESIAASSFGCAREAANSAGMTIRPHGRCVENSVIDVVWPVTFAGGASGETSLRLIPSWRARRG